MFPTKKMLKIKIINAVTINQKFIHLIGNVNMVRRNQDIHGYEMKGNISNIFNTYFLVEK